MPGYVDKFIVLTQFSQAGGRPLVSRDSPFQIGMETACTLAPASQITEPELVAVFLGKSTYQTVVSSESVKGPLWSFALYNDWPWI